MSLSPKLSLSHLVQQAMAVRSVADFESFRSLLTEAGADHERPVGDQTGNVTAISASGDPQHLVFELVTNSIDGILERLAAERRQAGIEVPDDPRTLAASVWDGGDADIANRIVLSMRESGEELRPTFTMRDIDGIGIAPAQVRHTIMSLNQSPKNMKLYLAGAFGKGGGTLHRESRGCVIVGRPSPQLCAELGCADEIWMTAVWATHEPGGKVRCWVYAVTDQFDPDHPGTTGGILSFPADGIDFAPGVMVTHVAYNAADLARHTKAAVDSRSLWVMGNTRLFDPVLPWSYTDERSGTDHKTMYGRARHFRDGSPQQMRESPIVAQVPVQDPDTGEIYELGLAAYLFERSARRNATARDHVVGFITNGQIQAHWDAAETRKRTAEAQGSFNGLRRVAENVLFLEVNCDQVPHVRRSEMVAPDRTHLTDTGLARAVQTAVADWLVNQPTISELEHDLALDASRGTSGVVIADKVLDEIGRKLGFTGVGANKTDAQPRPPEVLLPEPTALVGPQSVTVVAGVTKQISFSLNAEDDFFTRMGATATLVVTDLDPPVRGTPGALSRGRFTSSLVLDHGVDEGTYAAQCVVEWMSSATGSLKELRWDLKVRFVHEAPEVTPPDPKPGARPLVIMRDEGGTDLAGRLEDELTGNDWAELEPEQAAHAAKAGDQKVVALIVNQAFGPWTKYADELAGHHGDAVVTQRRNRYVVGAACAIGRLYGAAKAGTELANVPDELRGAVAAMCAEAVIASLPPAGDA